MRLFVAQLDNLISDASRSWKARRRVPRSFDRVYDFAQFMGETARRGRALVSFDSCSLTGDALRGRSNYFNPTGASLEIARALNQLGYGVDVVSYLDREFFPDRDYDLFVGHANVNWRQISEKLPEHALRVTYMTGCYWRDFEAKTEACYRRFCISRNLRREAVPVCRKISDEEYSTTQADLVICLGEETAKTFRPVARRVVPINNAAYLDDSPPQTPKDWDSARRHFLYNGGTGNIQKGVDLLIEAFVQEPECHLHLYAPLEPEILKAYSRELSAPNIHYDRLQRFLSPGVITLLHRNAFTLLCGGFATGQSTALIGCLGHGLIPVVNREADIAETGVRIEETSVTGVRAAVHLASRLNPVELAAMQQDTIRQFNALHTPEAFCTKFREAVAHLLADQKGTIHSEFQPKPT